MPTTAGSGSEVTADAVITQEIDGKHVKKPINDLKLVPKGVILDAQLTATLPASLTISSGMDAISHVIEILTNRYASRKTKEVGQKALPLLMTNLPPSCRRWEQS
ncbi:alcohol dehydrogenase class IV [Streptococcus gallinaceus]|nr:alcohol dehydrogenase class IV [Streptococcus gallinaceus]MCP1770913.1 alcohol dehydrogenase class IV [Streptococcus gallinaceus]